ncbi:MAG: RAMP superfamily CRISPR-associated protein [Lachnospiraceae bacterium]|nr:RAMP superfamily CRISPR-associated protein [Lachnospiraceae bacterium]
MKLKMELLSDVVFGNGMSIPGGEDISILCDGFGFPYYKGGTMKGIFREELIRYLNWTMDDTVAIEQKVNCLLGKSGDAGLTETEKIIFSDFQLSENVKRKMLEEIGEQNPQIITNSLSHIRTFTKLSEDGMTEHGSLRNLRCINKGLYFYSDVICPPEEEKLVLEVLQMIKWIGSMRNRGFGKVRIQKA